MFTITYCLCSWFWTELFLACHRMFRTFLTEPGKCVMPLVSPFSRMFFDIIKGEKIFIWASLYTFIGNYFIMDYFNILFILDLNSEFRNFKLWDQKRKKEKQEGLKPTDLTSFQSNHSHVLRRKILPKPKGLRLILLWRFMNQSYQMVLCH